ncbi:lactoylglutathione lyase [Zymomonas mobilis]|uniref:Lactoylglutathione lyase n=1 Tax=Zymomonas mobilis TaxID=542 RepID=A0A542W0T7_ZYMMB|nr:VOC family protein [Zymomonas mobilis]TQL17198.1 lactoylglutathione lyase [Zymomonas mobilis]
MRYIHTMIRVSDPDETIRFFNILGLEEVGRVNNNEGRFTLIYLAVPNDNVQVELTWNWDGKGYEGGRNFGHLAFEVDNIYESCQKMIDGGYVINRPPRDGWMAFIRTPDHISIELLQAGDKLEPIEPWKSMPNTGSW